MRASRGATGRAVRLADADGTVWRGRGTLVAAATRIPVAWDVDLWPLLRGIGARADSPGSGATTPRATIALHGNGIALRDVDVTVPAGVVAAFWVTPPQSVAGDVTAWPTMSI